MLILSILWWYYDFLKCLLYVLVFNCLSVNTFVVSRCLWCYLPCFALNYAKGLINLCFWCCVDFSALLLLFRIGLNSVPSCLKQFYADVSFGVFLYVDKQRIKAAGSSAKVIV